MKAQIKWGRCLSCQYLRTPLPHTKSTCVRLDTQRTDCVICDIKCSSPQNRRLLGCAIVPKPRVAAKILNSKLRPWRKTWSGLMTPGVGRGVYYRQYDFSVSITTSRSSTLCLFTFAHIRNILKQVMTIYKDKLVGKWTWTDAQLQVIMSLSRLQ